MLEREVKRMLADPKADALVENFGDQLFYLRNLPSTSPDGVFYPNWDDELRKSFRRETELLFQNIIKETAASSIYSTPTTPSSTNASRSTMGSRTFTARSSAA